MLLLNILAKLKKKKTREKIIYTADCKQRVIHKCIQLFLSFSFALKQRTEFKNLNLITKARWKFSTMHSMWLVMALMSVKNHSPHWFYNHSLRLRAFQSNCVSKFIFPPKLFSRWWWRERKFNLTKKSLSNANLNSTRYYFTCMHFLQHLLRVF